MRIPLQLRHHPAAAAALALALLLLTAATPCLATTAEVLVLDPGGEPVPGALVLLDYDGDDTLDPELGEQETTTDDQGVALFASVTAVPDGPASADLVLGAPRYRPGTGEPATVPFYLPATATGARAALYDLAGRRLGPAVTLDPLPTGGTAYLPLAAPGTAPAGDGIYLLAVACGNRTRAVKLASLGRAIPGVRLRREAAAEPATKTGSRQVTIVVRRPWFLTAHRQATLQDDGPNSFSVTLTPLGTVTVHGRTGDELGHLLSVPARWVFTNTCSAEQYTASLDSLGYWSVLLPDTIPPERQIAVRFEADGYRSGTFTFLRSDQCSATGTEFTGVDIYSPATGGTTDFQTLAYPAGHTALTFSQASAENDTIISMIRDPWTNRGVVKWVAPDRILYNQIENYPEREYIGEERKAQQEIALNFVAGIDKLPGPIAHPFYASTSGIIETVIDSLTPPPTGSVIVSERNDTGAGNMRGPPPGYPTFTYAVGHTPAGAPTSQLVVEIMEAMGINDYSNGSNGCAFTYAEDGTVIDLNHIGWVVICVASTYLPGDFSAPNPNR